jgi:hypothetical protein
VTRLHAAAAALLILAGFAAWALLERQARIGLRAELELVRSDLNVAQAAIAQAAEAARVHRVYLDRAAQRDQEWAKLEAELRSLDGRDAPLSPFLRSAAERLWPDTAGSGSNDRSR